ncbi:MAG: DUF1049 domain-containing protein [Rubrivivax sp.]|jgi:putative membrane protein|nr:DUF1049 domain-containing protein [Rubrivivax sp.]
MRFLVWLLRGFIFFALFAFALNNQQTATINWFFGVQWHARMVILVLVAFAAGCAAAVLAMLPSWWRYRRMALRYAPEPPVAPAVPANSVLPSEFAAVEHPPRVGP